MPEKVTHIKCKQSPSLLHENLRCGSDSLIYLHLNEAHILKTSELQSHLSTTTSGRASTTVVAYADKDPVTQVQFCNFSFGEVIVLLTLKGQINIYDKTGQNQTHTFAHTEGLKGICCTPKSMFVGTSSGAVLVFSVDAKDIKMVTTVNGHSSPITALCIAGKQYLVTADESGSVKHWNLDGMASAGECKSDGYPVTSMSCNPDWLAVGNSCGHIKLFTISKSSITLFADIAAHARSISSVHVHPTQPMVGSCSEDTYLSVYSLPTAANSEIKLVSQVSPNDALLTGLCWFDKSTLAVTAFDSRYLSVLQLH